MNAIVSASDLEFLRRFEECTLPEQEWTHLAHLRIAWICLALDAPDVALRRVKAGILQYNTEVLGRRHQYHETVTVSFMRIVSDRTCVNEDWAFFSNRIDDFLSADDPIILRYYSKSLLFSDLARQQFVSPDIAQLPTFGSTTGVHGG